jgi:cardiolipin synthase
MSQVYHNGDEFFAAQEAAIEGARRSVDFEAYIFASDRLGQRMMAALVRAAARGIRVRLMVDGIGSSAWSRTVQEWAREAGLPFRIYHQLPWERWWRGGEAGPRRTKIRDLFRRMNNRNHRKVCIIDSAVAFLGSMNVIEYHVPSLAGTGTWRDTGAMVVGRDVVLLERAFELAWFGSLRRLALRLRGRLRRTRSTELVKFNTFRRQREDNYLDLLVRIIGSQRRAWITNAYFVPDGSLLRALSVAAEAGVDVRVLVPQFTDVWFIPWVSSAFHLGLLRAGVRVFEYNGTVLHAKTMIIDDWAIVGSSNLNHRSLLHDLEADVVLPAEKDRSELERQFLIDLQSAQEVTLDTWSVRPWVERLIGRCLLAVRFLL